MTTTPQHTDFAVQYRYHTQTASDFKQNFQILARSEAGTFDLGNMAEQLSWMDQSADTLALVNSQVPLTGTLQLRKPSLNQYDRLMPFLSAAVTQGRTARFGALGIVIVCKVGYGKSYLPVWAMRVSPGDGNAEQIELQDGTWSLQLADDLSVVNRSLADFKYTRGKVARKQGWRAHEITVDVCRRYRIPVKQLARGTAWFELPVSTTTAVSPLMVISAAYEQETKRTGRIYVIRWAAPDAKHPLGALEVMPMRRNPMLMTFRDQLVSASLTRDYNPDFATVIESRGTLKQPHGKHKPLTFLAHSAQAIRRFGWITKIVDFGPVSSHLELQILAQRALAYRLTPIRGAQISNPGVATIRRGDAIRLDIPEEGYSKARLAIDTTPSRSSGALLAAERNSPSMFGLPDPTLLSATGAASLTTDVTSQNTGVVLPVADQGIGFVTSATHTVAAGSYNVDIQLGFVDVLDPLEVRASIDAALRANKHAARKR